MTDIPHSGPDGVGAPLVEATGITVRFDDHVVLRGVDLTVDAGEIVTLIGPNGSGKSTLVRVILGLVVPDEGHVRRRARMRVGYVPQTFRVDPSLPISVRRFLLLSAPDAGRGKHGGIDAALAEVGAGHTADNPLQTLSGGESRRVLLAQALLREPELLVLDEPSAGVDAGGQAELYDLIRAVRDKRGCGVLLVSHDLHLVMAATDRVVCLNHHVCCSGRPEAVSRDPEYLALFGPDLARALAVYTHDHDHEHDLSGEEHGSG
jgi:zinc transport system ATP-binding protein